MSDEGLTQRERRRQEFEKEGKPFLTAERVRKALPWTLVLLIGGGVAGGMIYTASQTDECPDHWHATFRAYVDGELVPFDAFSLENGRGSHDSHLHAGDARQDVRYQIHYEGGQCVDFGDFSSHLDMALSSGRMVLDGLHEQTGFAGDYRDEGNRTVQLFHAPNGDDWAPISASALNKRQLHDGERLLVLYGSYTAEEIAALQQTVPDVAPDA